MKEVVDPFWGVTPRFMLQKIGTDCIRTHYDEDVWIRALELKLKVLTDNGKDVVITDVRFPNEGDVIKALGGYVVNIIRDVPGATGGISGHSSEVIMDDYDGWSETLVNDGTKAKLYNLVEIMIAGRK